MRRNELEWIDFLTKLGCLWIHDGNPKRPHALLTSGKHSDGFFNGSKIIKYPEVTRRVCEDLLEVCKLKGVDLKNSHGPQMVFGSAHGATNFSFMMGILLGIDCGFTEPQPDGSMILKRFDFEPETPILLIEDVMTTGGTNRKTIRALEDAGGIVIDPILAICNRSGMKDLDGRRVVALIDKKLPMWEPEDCPLCEAGSEAIRPKGNWDKLTASY